MFGVRVRPGRISMGVALALACGLVLALSCAPRAHAVGESLPWSAPDYLSPEGVSGLAPSCRSRLDTSTSAAKVAAAPSPAAIAVTDA